MTLARPISRLFAAALALSLLPSSAPGQPDAARARAALARFAAAAPRDPQAQLELALFDRNRGDIPAAEARLRSIWQRFPRFPRAPFYLGLIYLLRGDDAGAVRPFKAAAAIAPSDALAQMHAGLALSRVGLEDEARIYAWRAVRLDEHRPEPYLLLARLYSHHGTALKAIGFVRKYLQRSPEPAPGYYLIGRLYARLADKENARTWLIKAVEAAPQNPEYLATLGRVYYEMFGPGSRAEAVRLFRKALEIDPESSETNRLLARADMDEGRYAEAAERFRAAARRSAHPYDLSYDLGQALLKAGQTEEGSRVLAAYQAYRARKSEFTKQVSRFNKAIAAAPRARGPRYELARFCISVGQLTAAENVLREAERLLGPDPASRQLMVRLRTARASSRAAAPLPGLGLGGAQPFPGSEPVSGFFPGPGGAR